MATQSRKHVLTSTHMFPQSVTTGTCLPRREEKACRFCAQPMPDYKRILSPEKPTLTSAAHFACNTSSLPIIKVRGASGAA